MDITPSDTTDTTTQERTELLREQEKEPEKGWCSRTVSDLPTILLDIVLSIPFYYVMVFLEWPKGSTKYVFGSLLVLMILYRLGRAYIKIGVDPNLAGEPEVPYTVGVIKSNDKTMFLVATIHISPRAPEDVIKVIDTVSPDVVMIELDDERLDKMRSPDQPQDNTPKQEDLQEITIELQGGEAPETMKIYAQRAVWNAEQAGEAVDGPLVFDKANEYGLMETRPEQQSGYMSLVKRGSANGEFAPFALKAHLAARSGAGAVLIVNNKESLPMSRIGASVSVVQDMKVACYSRSCGFPPICAFMIKESDGEKLQKALADGARVGGSLSVRTDTYPRRTLRKRLCQACALVFSGIGILYGIIQCFAIEVGAEFLAAEEAAYDKKLPCECIDSDLNSLWGRLGEALLPTPCNFVDAVLSWLAFPRIAFQALFPPRHNVDVFGSMVLHAKSFSIRTWVAFFIAGYCASWVTSNILKLLTGAAERGAEQTGMVKKEDRDITTDLMLFFLQLYLLPRIFEAFCAHRDEVMYRSIVAKSRTMGSSRMVVVVGAGHSNGILQRARARGL
jgi:pheromone shutdown protein TraB